MIVALFWVSAAAVVYAYIGYPCALAAIAHVRHRPIRRAPATCPVSFIITVHNEASCISAKIANTIAQDYPGPLEILVASDCSTDGTDEIVRSYEPRVRLVRTSERRGKEAAQQLAINAAGGEVIVFSDVATALAADGVSRIAANFADSTVGCVSSIDRLVDAEGRTSGEGAYVRYEMALRALETRVNSLVGLSGSFFAARRRVCVNWAADRPSDFNTVLSAVQLGLRGVLDPLSIGYYRQISDARAEFQRKVRTVIRGMVVLGANAAMLNPVRHGLFAWQLASHKLCRWLVPVALVLAVVTNAALAAHSSWYAALLGIQIAFYCAAAGGWLGVRALKIPFYFFVANLAILVAWFRYARGERMTVWQPSARPPALPQICADEATF